MAGVTIAPGGAWFATTGFVSVTNRTGGYAYKLPQANVRLWDSATGAQLAILPDTGMTPTTGVAIASDGTWLAAGFGAGSSHTNTYHAAVYLWDRTTHSQRASLTGHTGWVTGVAIAPDGTWLATGGQDGTVRLWRAADGTEQATLTGHTGWVTGVAIAPDGTWLATTGRDDKTVRLWDLVGSSWRSATLAGHKGALISQAWSHDRSRLATAGNDGTVRLWEV